MKDEPYTTIRRLGDNLQSVLIYIANKEMDEVAKKNTYAFLSDLMKISYGFVTVQKAFDYESLIKLRKIFLDLDSLVKMCILKDTCDCKLADLLFADCEEAKKDFERGAE